MTSVHYVKGPRHHFADGGKMVPLPKSGDVGAFVSARSSTPMLVGDRLAKACLIAGITVQEAKSPCRSARLCRGRFHVMAILRSAGWTMPRIGQALGGRDHTTVLHGLKRWEELTAEGGGA